MRIFGRILLFAGLWWVLAEGRLDGWLLGGGAIVAATWASLKLWPATAFRLRLLTLPGFLAFFLLHSLRGGIQVAVMALRGKSALMPGCVELPLSLPAGAPQILLTYTLGLMPGTVGIELAHDRLRVHALDVRLPIAQDTRALEQRIATLFGAAA